LAATAEHRQTHPIALAIVAAAAEQGLALPDTDNAHYELGYGIRVDFHGRTICVGSDRFMERSRVSVPAAIQEQRALCYERGHSLIMVALDGMLAGAIELEPTIRPEVHEVLGKLRERGLKLMIISGDQEEPTRRLATSLGIHQYFANVLPEGKADLVEELQARGHAVCFVGDGINDSIALKKANVSVSLRGATTVATDSAQVVLMQESLQKLPFLFELSDDMEWALEQGHATGLIPGVINVAGVFLLGWRFYQSLALNVISTSIAMGIALYPRYKHRKLTSGAGSNEAASDRAPAGSTSYRPVAKPT
jgi:P-type E1-E2 ATPase